MSGNTSVATGVDGGVYGESAAATQSVSGERRPSIVALQNMLKRVSQSPFHNQYQTLVSSSDSSFSPVSDFQNKMDDEFLLTADATNLTNGYKLPLRQNGVQEPLHVSPQNGINGDLTRMNPFYTHYLKSGNKDHAMKDAERKTAEEVKIDTVFSPRPEYESTPLDLHPRIKTLENGINHMQDLFQTSTLGQNTSANGFYDITLNSPDLFKANLPQSQNRSESLQSKNSDLFKGEVDDLFQTAEEKDFFHAVTEVNVFDKSSNVFMDPLKSPSNKDDDVFQSPQPTVADPFYSAKASDANVFEAFSNGGELFQMKENKQGKCVPQESLNIFSHSSTNSVDPFPSPLRRDLFQEISSLDDPFGTFPSKHNNLFQDVSSGSPDVFEPLRTKTNTKDIFSAAPSTMASKATYSTLNSPSEMKLDMQSSPDVLNATPSKFTPATPSESFNSLRDIVLTTPQGTEHDILRPTPFNRARNLAMSLNHSPTEMSHVRTMKRPPKPLPRTRPPRTEKPEKPPKPEDPPTPAKLIQPEPPVPKISPKPAIRRLPKLVLSRKPKTPESEPLDPKNYVVFEDVLLIGQEQCVEDWPEDSPELNPDFTPLGKLRLRRQSLKVKEDFNGESSGDLNGSGSQSKKKDKKSRKSILPKRGSKDKFPDDAKVGKNKTLYHSRKSSMENFSETPASAGENEDGEQDAMDYRKKPLKTKVSSLLRRSSATSSMREGKRVNGCSPQESKGKMFDESTGEEEEEGESTREEAGSHRARRKSFTVKFVPHRGFAITVQKPDDELKGAHGYTPRKGSKEKSHDDVFGAHGYTPRKKSMDDNFEDVEDMKAHSLQSSTKAAFMDNGYLQKTHRFSDTAGQSELDEFGDDAITGKDFMSPGVKDELENKPKKFSKFKGLKKPKAKKKAMYLEREDPPGAASRDYLSEAAKAEWIAAQKDERAVAGSEDEDEEGDTDSLMEWWYTVEQWDEVPSDEEDNVMKDESKSFTILADKVHRGLRVFNKVFMERAEVLWQSAIILHTIAEDINNFHNKAKIAGITGGTTTAVGGVTAIAGLALAPFTLGASLIVTAVGVGVATAGGIASASAAISDNVNNMHDQKKVETVLQEYEAHLLTIGKILHFVNQGLYKLRGHPFLRSGTQHYSEEWEIRKAVQMISLVDLPVMRATEITDEAVASVQALFKGIDEYFIKESRELKKGYRKEVVAHVNEVANVLNEAIVELNNIREALQDATGDM